MDEVLNGLLAVLIVGGFWIGIYKIAVCWAKKRGRPIENIGWKIIGFGFLLAAITKLFQ